MAYKNTLWRHYEYTENILWHSSTVSEREENLPSEKRSWKTLGGALIRSWGARKGTADLAGQPGHPQFRNSCSRDNRPRGSTKPASSVAVGETSPSVLAHTLQVAQKKLSGPSISLSQNEAIKYHRALLLQVWSMDQQHQQHLGLVRDADSRPPRRILNQNFCGSGAQGICLNNPLDNSDAGGLVDCGVWSSMLVLHSHHWES